MNSVPYLIRAGGGWGNVLPVPRGTWRLPRLKMHRLNYAKYRYNCFSKISFESDCPLSQGLRF